MAELGDHFVKYGRFNVYKMYARGNCNQLRALYQPHVPTNEKHGEENQRKNVQNGLCTYHDTMAAHRGGIELADISN